MKLRDALIQQSPSLELQRAAADEIAKLDKEIEMYKLYVFRLTRDLTEAHEEIEYLEGQL